MRKSLSQPARPIAMKGEPDAAQRLADALTASREDADALTHGFHSYPARMHPSIAREVIAGFSLGGARVLDPFCGSGTVLVEAAVLGRRATGVDLSPLALRIAEVHCQVRSPAECERFLATLELVVAASFERVRNRVKARAPVSARERTFFEPHVLLELAGLREEIVRVEPEADRRALEIVLSSLLVKFSRQRADTSEEHTQKRLRKGLATEFFERKGRELLARWAALAQAMPRDAAPVQLRLGDARELPALLGRVQFDLVVSSPPYGGTYDYHAHHARRYPWLGIDAQPLEQGEVGARRRLSTLADGAVRWERELGACLRAIAGVCAPGARVALLCGDAQVAGKRVDAADQLTRLGPRAGLSLVASASHARVDYTGGTGGPLRREHLVLLVRD
jgi:hypothetical protein